MSDQSVPLKRCFRCKEEKPATSKIFRKSKASKDGLSSWCLSCHREYDKAYDKIRNEMPERKTYAKKTKHARYERQKEDLKKKQRDYNHSPQGRATRIARQKLPRTKSAMAVYRQSEKGKISALIQVIRRHSRKKGVITDFTSDDWIYAVNYFHFCCAVCGKQAHDLFGTLTMAKDHWIPLSQKGDTIPANIVPLCHGEDGCNNSKSDKMPHDWLVIRYGKLKAAKIEKRIQAFFATVRVVR